MHDYDKSMFSFRVCDFSLYLFSIKEISTTACGYSCILSILEGLDDLYQTKMKILYRRILLVQQASKSQTFCSLLRNPVIFK